jgi:hypothetical protein
MKEEMIVKRLEEIIDNLTKEKGNVKIFIELDNLLLAIMDDHPKKYYKFVPKHKLNK